MKGMGSNPKNLIISFTSPFTGDKIAAKIPVITTHERKCGKYTTDLTALAKALFLISFINIARNTGTGKVKIIFNALIVSVFLKAL